VKVSEEKVPENRLIFGQIRPTSIRELGLPLIVEARLLEHSEPIDTVEKLGMLSERYLRIHVYRLGKGSIAVINAALEEHGYPALKKR
jgi:hypothetical protein